MSLAPGDLLLDAEGSRLRPAGGEPEDGPVYLGWQAPICDFLLVLLGQARLILLVLLLGGAGGVAIYQRTPPVFKAAAVGILMPRERPSIDNRVMTGSLVSSENRANRERSGVLMLPPNPELYLTLVYSQPVLEAITGRFQARLWPDESERPQEPSEALKRLIKVETSEEGLLTICVEAADPTLAADLANAFLVECREASEGIERQLLTQQAEHLRQAIERTTLREQAAAAKLKRFAARRRVVDPSLQASHSLRLVTETLAARDRAQSKLEQRLLHFTERDPRVQALRQEVREAEQDLRRQRREIVGQSGEREFGSLVVEYRALGEELKACRDLRANLRAQADLFRIRAKQPSGNLVIVRAAVPPSRRAGPSRKRHAALTLALTLLAALGLALVRHQWQQGLEDPYVAQRLAELRARVGRRSRG